MWGYPNNGYGMGMTMARGRAANELRSDLWIQQNVPGGLNSISFFRLMKSLIDSNLFSLKVLWEND